MQPAFAALAGVVVLGLGAASCSSDDDGGAERSAGPPASATTTAASGETVATTTTVAAASVPTFAGRDICAFVPATRVGAALGGVSVTEAQPSQSGTPQCSYSYTGPDGAPTNVVLAVMRPVEDLGGASGATGHDVAFTANVLAGGAVPEEVPAIGDRATWFAGPPVALMIASRGDQVVTVSGTALTQEQAGALANMLLSEVT